MKKIVTLVLLIVFLVLLSISGFLLFRNNQKANKTLESLDDRGVWIYPESNLAEKVNKVEIVSGVLRGYSFSGNQLAFRIEEINSGTGFDLDTYDITINLEASEIPIEVWNFDGEAPKQVITADPEAISGYIEFRVEIEMESDSLYSDFTKINRFIVYEN